MQVVVLEDAAVDVQSVGMSSDVFQGEERTFFHNVAQVAGKCQLAPFASAQACLDEEDFPADARPCKSCHHARIVVALIGIAAEDGLAQKLFCLFSGDGMVFCHLTFCHTQSYSSEELIHLLLKATYTTFACITFDDELQCLLPHFERCMLFQPILVAVLGDEMSLCYFYLLLRDIAVHLDELHTVE